MSFQKQTRSRITSFVLSSIKKNVEINKREIPTAQVMLGLVIVRYLSSPTSSDPCIIQGFFSLLFKLMIFFYRANCGLASCNPTPIFSSNQGHNWRDGSTSYLEIQEEKSSSIWPLKLHDLISYHSQITREISYSLRSQNYVVPVHS